MLPNSRRDPNAPSRRDPNAPTDHTGPSDRSAYYHADGNGNGTAMINTSGRLVAHYHYDPYGNLVAMAGPLAQVNRYRYSNKEIQPNSKLYYYGFRFYDPSLQRWINQDPIGEVGGINLYGFVGNDPVNFVDTDGRIAWAPVFKGGLAIGIAIGSSELWDRFVSPHIEDALVEVYLWNPYAETAATGTQVVMTLKNAPKMASTDCSVTKEFAETSRRRARDLAQRFAQVPRKSKGGEDIEWKGLNDKDKHQARIRRDGGKNMGRRDPNSPAKFEDHPEGHPHLVPGPPHHESPHYHGGIEPVTK